MPPVWKVRPFSFLLALASPTKPLYEAGPRWRLVERHILYHGLVHQGASVAVTWRCYCNPGLLRRVR